jgi:hypothetical protein
MGWGAGVGKINPPPLAGQAQRARSLAQRGLSPWIVAEGGDGTGGIGNRLAGGVVVLAIFRVAQDYGCVAASEA